MSNKNFYNKLNKLRTKVKERRKQELYDMINDENNKYGYKGLIFIYLLKVELFKLIRVLDKVNKDACCNNNTLHYCTDILFICYLIRGKATVKHRVRLRSRDD